MKGEEETMAENAAVKGILLRLRTFRMRLKKYALYLTSSEINGLSPNI